MMYSSRSADNGKEISEDERMRQSNVPHFDILEETDWIGPKQTNASGYFSGQGTLSRSKRDVFGCSTRSVGRSKAQENSQIQPGGRDVPDALFEEPSRRLAGSERNISEEEDQWLAHQERIYPSTKTNPGHGIPQAHEQSRLSTEGSFHLSHLERDSISEESDEMEYSSGSNYVSSAQRTTEVYLQPPLISDSSHDTQPRSRRTNSIRHKNPSSKHDGLSWQQYKALATKRKEAESYTQSKDIEDISRRSYAFTDDQFRTSASIIRNEPAVFHEPDDHLRTLQFDMSTGGRSPSPLTRSALNTFQSQGNQSRDNVQPGHDTRSSTLLDGHHAFDLGKNCSEDYGFKQEYLHGEESLKPHQYGTNRHHSSSFHSPSEEGDDRLDLEEFAPPGAASGSNILENQMTSTYSISEFRRVSERTNIQSQQDPKQFGYSIISRTNSLGSELDSSRRGTLNAESQDHEQIHSVLPAVLEQTQNGARLTTQSLPFPSSSALDRTSSGNSSSFSQKRPRRRKLEAEFSNSQAFSGETIEITRQNVEGDTKPLGISDETDLRVKPDFLRDTEMPNPPLSSPSISDLMSTSVQDGQRTSLWQLREPDYLVRNQQGGHCSWLNQSETERKDYFKGTHEPSRSFVNHSFLPSDTSAVQPQRISSDALESSRPTPPTDSAFPDRFDPVQDLLMSSSIQSTKKGPANVKATSHSLRNEEPNDARTFNYHSLTTSTGSALQYSSALSSYLVQSQDALDQSTSHAASALEGRLTQHYSFMGPLTTNQRLEKHENVTSSVNQSSHRSVHSSYSKFNHQSGIETAADVDQPDSSRRDWYLHSGSHITSLPHEDLLDVYSNRDSLSFSSPERRLELQRAMNYHLEDKICQDLSVGTSSHSNKKHRCLASRTSARDSGRFSQMSFSTSGSPRRVTSILWVFKLLDILHNHPVERHEVLVSQAYWFRRWLSKVRLLKMIRQEEKDRWRIAVTFYNITIQQKCLRQWMATVQSRSKSARLLYQHRLLHKGLSAFRFAVMSSRIQAIQLETRLKVMTLAKYFSKWNALTQLRKEKETILEQIANQHVTVKAFSVWKEGYHTQQRIGIADLHYKVGLLSKSIEQWKKYVVHRRKRFYQTEVARVFHEDRLIKKAWVTMATIYDERQKARRQFRWSMLCRSWRAWRHGIQIIKMENLHDNAKAMVFRDKAMHQRFFADWKERTKVSMMKHRREMSQLIQAFELWKLKHHGKQILCGILDSKARKSLQKRAFSAWREHTKRSLEARLEGLRLIRRVQMGVMVSAWRSWTHTQIYHRQNLQEHLAVRNAGIVGRAFHQWRLCWLKERALHQGLKRWSENCLKRAVQRWKKHVVERRREDKAVEFAKQSANACLKRSLCKWVKGKAQADHERRRVADFQGLLTRSQLHRTFLAWKLEMMVTRAVRPLTERREKRCLAKAFDGWRDIITRKKKGQSFAERGKNGIIARTFTYWRNQTESRLRAKQEQDSLEASLVQGCFQAWQRLHQRKISSRIVTKQWERECLRDAFTSWKAQAEEVELEREIQMGKEQRGLLLQKVFFKTWRRVSGDEAVLENERCSLLQDKLTASTLLEMWKRWRRSMELELKARSIVEKNQHRMLEEAFRLWHRYTQQSISAAVEKFHERLNESCSSFQSPPLAASFSPSLSPSSSSSSSSSSSGSLPSHLHIHQTPSPSASSPLPLRELSVHHLEKSYAEFSHSVMDRRAVQPSVSPGSVEVASPHGEDASYVLLDCVRGTPSPLRNLPLGNSPGDREDTDFICTKEFEVIGQLESVEGSVISLDQGVESSGQSVESHPSHFGISSVVDSGYHANGFTMFSNGESQLEASSDSASVRSAKDYVSTVDALRKSPHKNNNNSAFQLVELSQHKEEWAGFTTHWCSSDNPSGNTEDDTLFLGQVASPGSVQNGNHTLMLENSTRSISSHSRSASSTVACLQVVRSRCANGISDSSNLDIISSNQEMMSFPVEVDLKMEDNDHDDGDVEDYGDDDDDNEDVDGDNENIINGSVGSESSLLTPKKSTAQFKTLQTSTAITNKKAYLTSIILRLRLWPASAAFYQWLEYTRMKKMHRQYRALVEGRMNDADLRAAFQLWRQHSSESQLAGNYLKKRMLEKYFRTWFSFKERESKQERQQAIARQHASHMLLKSAWNTWKEHFLLSLYPIGPRPSFSTHFSQSQLMSQRCASFQTKIQGRNVRECLMFWRLRWRQLQEADHYRTSVILKRCLIAWSRWRREKKWREEAARIMCEARRKKMAFLHWKKQLAKLILIHTHYHGAAHNHLCLIIRAWHRWAETTKRLRLCQEVMTQRYHTVLLNQAWLLWKREEEKSRRGQAFHDGKILQRTFSGWKTIVHEMKQRRLVVDSIQSIKKLTTLSACFKHWKMKYNVRKFVEVRKDRQARRMIVEVLAAWKMFVAERHCEKQKQQEVLQEAFSIWRNQYVTTKRRNQLALSAATHWRHVVRRSKKLTETMNLFRCTLEERKRKQTFVWWQRTWISHQLADHHYNNRLLNKSMQGLRELLKMSQDHVVKEQSFVSWREKALLEVYFRRWKDRQSHMTNLHVAAAKVEGELADRSLAEAFLKWRLRYRERKTEYNYQHKLIQKVWKAWRESQASHEKANSMRRGKEKCLLRKTFIALRNWARDHSGRRIVLQCVQTRKNHFTLKTTFAVWRDESRLRQLARDHHNVCIQRMAMISWRSFNQKQKVLSSLHQKVTCRVNKRRQLEALRVWKDTFKATREADAKLNSFMKRKETSLLSRCFSDWRDELDEVQAKRLRENRMMRWVVTRWRRSIETKRLIQQYERDLEELAVLHWEQSVRREHFNKWRSNFEAVRCQRRQRFLEQKYGLIWKRHTSQTLMAQAVARYWRLERCWKAWRKSFIMDQVSKEIFAQDQRVLLTKIFNKWHQLAVQGRTELATE